MNILGYLQKVGRALMVPVAVLPAGLSKEALEL